MSMTLLLELFQKVFWGNEDTKDTIFLLDF